MRQLLKITAAGLIVALAASPTLAQGTTPEAGAAGAAEQRLRPERAEPARRHEHGELAGDTGDDDGRQDV